MDKLAISSMVSGFGFYPVYGTLEKVNGMTRRVKKGTPLTWDINNGVIVVYVEDGFPWICHTSKAPPKLIEGVAAAESQMIRGAYVPHSSDGGNFVYHMVVSAGEGLGCIFGALGWKPTEFITGTFPGGEADWGYVESWLELEGTVKRLSKHSNPWLDLQRKSDTSPGFPSPRITQARDELYFVAASFTSRFIIRLVSKSGENVRVHHMDLDNLRHWIWPLED